MATERCHTSVDSVAHDYDAALYRQSAAAAEYCDSIDAVGETELQRFREQGYLAIRRALDPAQVSAACAGLRSLIMGEVPEFNNVQFEAKAREILPTLTPQGREDAVRKLMYFVDFHPSLHAGAWKPELIALITRLLGESPQMFQDMALLKPPHGGREKPWHQDHAYFDFPLGTRIVGVWIALDEATIENGCMHLIPGGHKGGPCAHFNRRDWQICDTDIVGHDIIAVPLEPGGCLLFDGLLPHGTPANTSDKRRRALQFHYAPASARKAAEQTRLSIFGAEGRAAEC